MAERQRRNSGDRPGGEDFADGVRELQGNGNTIAKDARVVVQFGEGDDVLKNSFNRKFARSAALAREAMTFMLSGLLDLPALITGWSGTRR